MRGGCGLGIFSCLARKNYTRPELVNLWKGGRGWTKGLSMAGFTALGEFVTCHITVVELGGHAKNMRSCLYTVVSS